MAAEDSGATELDRLYGVSVTTRNWNTNAAIGRALKKTECRRTSYLNE